MQLHERLMDLLGHEVLIIAEADGAGRGIPSGIIKEVGPDFVIIGAKGDRAESSSDWWIRMAMIVAVVHSSSCARCAADAAG